MLPFDSDIARKMAEPYTNALCQHNYEARDQQEYTCAYKYASHRNHLNCGRDCASNFVTIDEKFPVGWPISEGGVVRQTSFANRAARSVSLLEVLPLSKPGPIATASPWSSNQARKREFSAPGRRC
jgi:hypothetical protein